MVSEGSIENLFSQRDEELKTEKYFTFKSELILAKNIYNTSARREQLEALAQTIQNMMIMETGTYPNQPELGVGIENYEFEFLDSTTLNSLKEKIDNNITKFIPTNITIDFDVDTIKNNTGKNILFFTFLVSGNSAYTDTSQIGLLFGKDGGKVVSKILI
jgi:phage baseplate assembly protein W